MEVIGIAAQAQNGKDTLADHLCTILNKRRPDNHWRRSAFAKGVKQIFMDTFAKDADYIEKWKTRREVPPDLDMEVRKALQFIGDGFRQIKASIWIDLMFRDKTTPKIISDARYANELKAVKAHGGYTVLVVKPDRLNDDPNGSEAEMRLFAEFALACVKDSGLRQFSACTFRDTLWVGDSMPPFGWEHVDYVIINDGTIEDFYARIDEYIVPLIEEFFKRAA